MAISACHEQKCTHTHTPSLILIQFYLEGWQVKSDLMNMAELHSLQHSTVFVVLWPRKESREGVVDSFRG